MSDPSELGIPAGVGEAGSQHSQHVIADIGHTLPAPVHHIHPHTHPAGAEPGHPLPAPTHLPPQSHQPAGVGAPGLASQHHQQQQIKIRIHNLYFPATFDIDELRQAMHFAQQTHVWFERPPFRLHDSKQGGVSMHFDTEEDAKRSFELIQQMTKKCFGLKIQAPRHFYEQQQPQPVIPPHLPVDENEPEMHLKLVVYQLLPSAEKPCLEALFDQDEMESIEIMNDTRKADGSKLAIVKFREESHVQSAATELDGFTIDDGDASRPIRCLPFADFVKKMKPGAQPAPSSPQKPKHELPTLPGNSSPSEHALLNSLVGLEQQLVGPKREAESDSDNQHSHQRQHSQNDEPPPDEPMDSSADSRADLPDASDYLEQQRHEPDSNEPAADAAFTDEDIAVAIDELIESERINWAELSTAEELWGILDRVSQALGGVVDKELKSGMMHVLYTHLQQTQADWMHRHLNELIRTWKMEVKKGKPRQPEPPKEVAAAPHYSPPREELKPKKPKSKQQKRQVIGLMGIGAMLAAAKEKYQPEDGEVKEAADAEKRPKTPPTPVHGPQNDPAKPQARKRPHTPTDDTEKQRSAKRSRQSKVNRQREEIRKLKQKIASMKRGGGSSRAAGKKSRTADTTADDTMDSTKQDEPDLEEGEMASSDGENGEEATSQNGEGNKAEVADKIVRSGSAASWSASSSSSSSSSSDEDDEDDSDEDSNDEKEDARSTVSESSDFSSSVHDSDNELEMKQLKARERRRVRRERQRRKKTAPTSGMSALMSQLMSMLSHMYKCRVELFKQMPIAQRQQLRTVFAQVRMHQSAQQQPQLSYQQQVAAYQQNYFASQPQPAR